MATCKSCGATIVWIKTPSSVMPCDAGQRTYRPDKQGDTMIVTPGGQVVRARLVRPGLATGVGYISHFATCPFAAQHKRREKDRADQVEMDLMGGEDGE